MNARKKTQNQTWHAKFLRFSAPGRHFQGIENKSFTITNTTIFVYYINRMLNTWVIPKSTSDWLVKINALS